MPVFDMSWDKHYGAHGWRVFPAGQTSPPLSQEVYAARARTTDLGGVMTGELLR
jgi:hypothetical protein